MELLARWVTAGLPPCQGPLCIGHNFQNETAQLGANFSPLPYPLARKTEAAPNASAHPPRVTHPPEGAQSALYHKAINEAVTAEWVRQV